MRSETVTPLPLPITDIDLPAWFFEMSGPTYLRASSAHLGMGSFVDPRGRRGAISIEEIAGVLMVHHYYAVAAEPHRLKLVSPQTRGWFARLIPIRFSTAAEIVLRPCSPVSAELVFRIEVTAERRLFALLLALPLVRAWITAHNREETAAFARDIADHYAPRVRTLASSLA